MIDEATFRALARSSPWLWSRVELDFADRAPYPLGPVHAVVERPGRAVITLPDGSRHDVVDEPTTATATFGWSADGSAYSNPRAPGPLPAQAPSAEQPTWRPDGLVARRPSSSQVATDDPMWQNYRWIAMLDPVELTDGPVGEPMGELHVPEVHGTTVAELAEQDRLGRASVVAVVRPTDVYEPRCGCCALLPNERIYRFEYGDDDRHHPAAWADAYRVVLDRDTGICVSLTELGGSHDGDGFDVTLHDVTRWTGRPSD